MYHHDSLITVPLCLSSSLLPLASICFTGWPHSSAPQPRIGATLCNAGGLWFSGLSEKSAKGKGRCTDGRLLVMSWLRSHTFQSGMLVMLLFFRFLCSERAQFYLIGWMAMCEGNGSGWHKEISNHRTRPANAQTHPLVPMAPVTPSHVQRNTNAHPHILPPTHPHSITCISLTDCSLLFVMLKTTKSFFHILVNLKQITLTLPHECPLCYRQQSVKI